MTARRDTRAELLAAATEEFARHGLPGARVQAIVGSARVNERMLYHHFGSKEGLYRAVLEEAWGALRRDWYPMLEDAAEMPPREGMRHALAGFFDVMWRRRALRGLLLHEAWQGFTYRVPAGPEALPPGLRELYRRGQRAGVFHRDKSFELFYCTVVGALAAAPILAGRFTGVLPALAEQTATEPIRDQMVALLMDGVCRSAHG